MIAAYSSGVAPQKPAKKRKKTAYSNGIVPQKPADISVEEGLFKRHRTAETDPDI